VRSAFAIKAFKCAANPLIDSVGGDPQPPRYLLRAQLLIDKQKTIDLGLCQLFDSCVDLVCCQRWPYPIAQL
jgi:hypothetical protein